MGSNIADTFTQVQDTIGGIFEPLLVSGGKFLLEVLEPIGNPLVYQPLQDAISELFAVFGKTLPEAESLAELVSNVLVEAIEYSSALILQIADTLERNPELIQDSLNVLEDTGTVLGQIVKAVGLASAGLLEVAAFLTKNKELVEDIGALFSGSIVNQIVALPRIVQRATDESEGGWSDFIGAIQDRTEGFFNYIQGNAREFWQSVQDVGRSVWDALIAYITGEFESLLRLIEQGLELIRSIATAATEAIKSNVTGIKDEFALIIDIGGKIGGTIADWANPLNKAKSILDGFTSGFKRILGLAEDVGTDVGKKLESTGAGGPLIPAPAGAFDPKTFPITSPFGKRNGRLHAGTDYGTPIGTPLANLFGPGVVTIAGSVGGYGNLIELTLDNGDVYRFGHLDQFNVRQGQRVPLGVQLGTTGNTGRSSGPHLHLEYYPRGGAPVDFAGRANNVRRFSRGQGGPGTLAQLERNVSERSRLTSLQRIQTKAATTRIDTALITGQINQFEADELIILERIAELNAKAAEELARLELEKRQAPKKDRDSVQELIDRYTELNEIELTNLTAQIDEVRAKQAKANQEAEEAIAKKEAAMEAERQAQEAERQAQKAANALLPPAEEFARSVTSVLGQVPGQLISILQGTQSLGGSILNLLGGLASQVGGIFLNRGLGFLQNAIGGLKLSRGAVLPGYGGGDRVPAFLEPGEAVLRKEVVRQVNPERLRLANQNPDLAAAILTPNMPAIQGTRLSASYSTHSSSQVNRTNNITINYQGSMNDGIRPTQRQLASDLQANLNRYG